MVMDNWERHDQAWAKFYADRGEPVEGKSFRVHPDRMPTALEQAQAFLDNLRVVCVLAVFAGAAGCGYGLLAGEDLGVTLLRAFNLW